MKLSVSLCFLLLAFPAIADPKTWMKQTTPNNLGLFTWVSGLCPFSEEELADHIKEVFLRAGLKPTTSLDFNLAVNVRCMSIEGQDGTSLGKVLGYEIRYGYKMANGENVLYDEPNHGSMLVGNNYPSTKPFFISSIKDSVAQSLNDYLKANIQ